MRSPLSQSLQCLSRSRTGPQDHRHRHTLRSVPGWSTMYRRGENTISLSFFSQESWVRSPVMFFFITLFCFIFIQNMLVQTLRFAKAHRHPPRPPLWKKTSLLVITSPAHDVLPIVWTDYTYDSEHGIAEGVPLAFRRSSSSQRGTWLWAAIKDIYNSCCCDWASQTKSTTSSLEEATVWFLFDFFIYLEKLASNQQELTKLPFNN